MNEKGEREEGRTEYDSRRVGIDGLVHELMAKTSERHRGTGEVLYAGTLCASR